MARCVGWHCLTTAQKFGIIFSVVVVAIVLAIAWMYYLGRVASSRMHRNFMTLPGGRRTRKNPNLPPTISLGELPIAQSWPGQPPQIIYQPVIYNIDPLYETRAQPYSMAGPCQVVKPPPVAYVPGQPYVTCPHTSRHDVWPEAIPAPHQIRQDVWPQLVAQTYQRQPRPQPRHRSASSPCPMPRDQDNSRRSSWSQTLNRAFGLPMGRASTIASSTTRNSESRSCPNSIREPSPAKKTTVKATRKPSAEIRAEGPKQPVEGVQTRGGAQSIRSQSSNAATVHSDDYDMVRSSSKRKTATSGQGNGARNGDCKLDVKFYQSLSPHTHNHKRPPRTPSPRPPVVVDLSDASDTVSDISNFSPSPVSGTGLPWNRSNELPKYR